MVHCIKRTSFCFCLCLITAGFNWKDLAASEPGSYISGILEWSTSMHYGDYIKRAYFSLYYIYTTTVCNGGLHPVVNGI